MGLEKIEMIAEGLYHPEGIAIAADGSLIVGGEAGQIYVVEPDGAFREIANTGGFALGIAADSDGHVYVCNDALNSVLRVTCSTGDVEQFASATEGRQMRVPNWPAFDSRGNLYVSDSGAWGARDGLIWVVRPGRRLEVFSDQAADFTNGLAVSADEPLSTPPRAIRASSSRSPSTTTGPQGLAESSATSDWPCPTGSRWPMTGAS